MTSSFALSPQETLCQATSVKRGNPKPADRRRHGYAEMRGLSIGELAQALDTTVRALRHYEDLGLLAPCRTGTRRIYERPQRDRASAIVELRRLRVPLSEISFALDDDVPAQDRRKSLISLLVGRLDIVERRVDRTRSFLQALRAEPACAPMAPSDWLLALEGQGSVKPVPAPGVDDRDA